MPVNIIVCVKQILDPEIPSRDFRVDAEQREAVRGAANLVTNIFCENALETALQLKEKSGGKITVISYGADSTEDALRKALAMKADAAIHILNDGQAHPDPLSVAQVLAAAIRKLGEFDVVMLGRESGDWGVGQTAGLLAEELGVAAVAFVDKVEIGADGLQLKRQTDVGYERVAATMPLVISITNDEHNVPRIPKTRDVMMSFRQPLTKWTLEDLGVNAAEVRAGNHYYAVVDLFIPVQELNCEFVDGDTLEARVEKFAQRIIEVTGSM
ncbi:MAG: electron transfer flavoprotein subunit beta/FixA family protein [Acidobacteria bacterium]|nr:electron transfer flavoprotein subunit beta/FixA family protein [Acidobacteriota bacterium]